jgi:CubicO group peptidase (beta-lactamase class C family)
LVLGACSDDGDGDGEATAPDRKEAPPTTGPPPIREWEEADPADVGLDAAPLEALGDSLGAKASDCMTVIKDGKLVTERYWNGTEPDTDREVFSVTKSVTSTLVGIAQDEGLLDIDEPASKYLTEWQGTPSESVTIANLLSNDSGRFWSQSVDYEDMIAATDKTAFSIGLTQQEPPGTAWMYNNSAIQTLEAVLERATGQPVADFAEERLFDPIGMTAEMSKDPAGNTTTFMGMHAGCRDLARFGQLYLNEGSWQGEEVVSSDWVEEAVEPSQELRPAYGYLWWLNRGGTDGASPDLRPWPSAPPTAYAALGLFDQIVLVLPEQDMVVVRIGGPPPEAPIGQGALADEIARLALQADGSEP